MPGGHAVNLFCFFFLFHIYCRFLTRISHLRIAVKTQNLFSFPILFNLRFRFSVRFWNQKKMMGQRGRLVEWRRKPEYVDFIQIILNWWRKALWFPNVVSFCRSQFDIKRTDLLAVLQHLKFTYMQPKFTQIGRTCFTFRKQKSYANRNRCMTCSNKQLSPRSRWGCCVTTG